MEFIRPDIGLRKTSGDISLLYILHPP